MFKLTLVLLCLIGLTMVQSQTITASSLTVNNASLEASATSKCSFVFTLGLTLDGGASAPANTSITVKSASNANVTVVSVVGPTSGITAILGAPIQSYAVNVDTPVGQFKDLVFYNGNTALTGGSMISVPAISCTEEASSHSSSSTLLISKISAAILGATLLLIH
ncbi:hypothetical protein DLAC_00358 [Tieghemostelium lacteum]|uniref:Uncharacterized protein n=1 Tax=Tieghemostelium lacteum TaxID=361077 RepID=A0A152A9I1_TIELA|nr:hypothetical protein DLAC_00358 [Tieghemostelium lacteum]|eukprot:KYR02882.1 hypothetical protein DLAC_00358 [Tieghemostelium lacteum]